MSMTRKGVFFMVLFYYYIFLYVISYSLLCHDSKRGVPRSSVLLLYFLYVISYPLLCQWLHSSIFYFIWKKAHSVANYSCMLWEWPWNNWTNFLLSLVLAKNMIFFLCLKNTASTPSYLTFSFISITSNSKAHYSFLLWFVFLVYFFLDLP